MSKIYLSEAESNEIMFDLLEKIEEDAFGFTRICGIARGGLPASRFLAEGLGLPHDEIKISFYESDVYVPWQPEVDIGNFSFSTRKDRVLFVDDLIYKGSTLNHLSNMIKSAKRGPHWQIATMFWNKALSPRNPPDYYGRIVETNQWIVFPWEQKRED